MICGYCEETCEIKRIDDSDDTGKQWRYVSDCCEEDVLLPATQTELKKHWEAQDNE